MAQESNAQTTSKDVTLSSVYAAKARKLDIDTTRSAKLVRARLRANFAHVCKLDPRIAKAKKTANDGNRWPKVVKRSVADFALGKTDAS